MTERIPKTAKKRDFVIPSAIIFVSLMVFFLINLQDLRHRWLIFRTAPDGEPLTTVQFEFLRGLIVLDAEVEGTEFRMILDSGAFENRITAESARASGIRPVLRNEVGDTYGRTAGMGIAVLDAIGVGEATWNRSTAGILAWGDGALTPCVAPDGIIGGTLMRHASWVIDYQAGLIHIGSRDRMPDAVYAASDPSSWSKVPVSLEAPSLVPRVSALINGRDVSGLLVDTGSNGALTLPLKFLDELAVPDAPRFFVSDQATSGIFGTAEISAIKAPVDFVLGDTAPRRVWATFTDDSTAKIGNRILSTYVIGLVPGENTLYIRQGSGPGPDALGESGEAVAVDAPLRHGFIPGISEDGEEWVVVYRETAAGEDGPVFRDRSTDLLSAGSRILRINGYTPGELYASRCEWFLGVRDLIETETLILELPDGSVVTLES